MPDYETLINIGKQIERNKISENEIEKLIF